MSVIFTNNFKNLTKTKLKELAKEEEIDTKNKINKMKKEELIKRLIRYQKEVIDIWKSIN